MAAGGERHEALRAEQNVRTTDTLEAATHECLAKQSLSMNSSTLP
jgi:hypothetical protein